MAGGGGCRVVSVTAASRTATPIASATWTYAGDRGRDCGRAVPPWATPTVSDPGGDGFDLAVRERRLVARHPALVGVDDRLSGLGAEVAVPDRPVPRLALAGERVHH